MKPRLGALIRSNWSKSWARIVLSSLLILVLMFGGYLAYNSLYRKAPKTKSDGFLEPPADFIKPPPQQKTYPIPLDDSPGTKPKPVSTG